MGWQAYLEYMQQMEEDSIMELNAVQEEYARNRKMTPNVMTQRNDSKLIGIIECTELSGGIRRSGKTKLLIYSHNLRQKLNPKQGENSKL